MTVNPDWPYRDLVCRTPDCPVCGMPAQMLVGAILHPMAFCTNEECNALSWDPTKTHRELLENAVEQPWPPEGNHA